MIHPYGSQECEDIRNGREMQVDQVKDGETSTHTKETRQKMAYTLLLTTAF